jgi:iron complex transport system ATP-binding protein
LISVLAGDRRPQSGSLTIAGRPLGTWRALELARRRAVLTQSPVLEFGFSAGEVVELGRLPFAGTAEAVDDDAALDAVRRRLDLASLWGQPFPSLSGGERQRVQLARVLAQLWRRRGGEPRTLLLDEPTSALDLRHRAGVLEVARELAADGVGVLAVLHDLNLAARMADDAVLLRDGCVLAAGPCASVLTAERLEACFDVPVELVARPGGIAAILA